MMGRLIAVVSGKGGVGKSMLVAAIGAQWAKLGKRVVLVDMNSGMRCLDMLFGLESRVVFDLGDVVAGTCGLNRALLEDKQTGVRLIAARQFGEGEPINERSLRILLEVLCSQNDFVILDAPGGIGEGYRLAARMADEFLLVTTPDDVSIRDAERLVNAQRQNGWTSPALVVNRLRPDLVAEGLQYTPQVCGQVLDLPVIGAIPEDGEVWRRMLAKQPLMKGPAARAVEVLRKGLEGIPAPLEVWREVEKPVDDQASQVPPPPDGDDKQRGFFARMRRRDRA